MESKLSKFFKHLEAIGFTGQVSLATSKAQAKLMMKAGKVASAHATGQRFNFKDILVSNFGFKSEDLAQQPRHKELELMLADLGVEELEFVLSQHNAAAMQKIATFQKCRVAQQELELESQLTWSVDELMGLALEEFSKNINPVNIGDILQKIVSSIEAIESIGLIDQDTGTVISQTGETLDVPGAFIPVVCSASGELCAEGFEEELDVFSLDTNSKTLFVTPIDSAVSLACLMRKGELQRDVAVRVLQKAAKALGRAI